MEGGGSTGECLEIVAVKMRNYSVVVVDEIDSGVVQIQCLCAVYILHYYLMLPQCHVGIVVSETSHQLEPYWLSSAEIRLSILYGNKRLGVIKLLIQLIISN